LFCFVTLLLGISQALDFSKVRVCNRAMEVAQGACTAELESDNAKLQSELEQAHQALVEAHAARNSLSVNQEKLEQEYTDLCTTIDALKEEKI
jgi:cellobiose-specific phosphotransferase system component IIA